LLLRSTLFLFKQRHFESQQCRSSFKQALFEPKLSLSSFKQALFELKRSLSSKRSTRLLLPQPPSWMKERHRSTLEPLSSAKGALSSRSERLSCRTEHRSVARASLAGTA
jgi:hypothetical protein